jgi:hypothetical protein
LTVNACAYLSPSNQFTVYYMKDLMSGKKLVSVIDLLKQF